MQWLRTLHQGEMMRMMRMKVHCLLHQLSFVIAAYTSIVLIDKYIDLMTAIGKMLGHFRIFVLSLILGTNNRFR